MSITTAMQRNKLMHLENTMVLYGIYNAETLENLLKTVHNLHSRQTLYKNLVSDRTSAPYESYSQMHNLHGIQHYAVNSMLYLRTIKDKYNKFMMNVSHSYTYMLRQSEFWLKVIYQFHS